VAKSPRGATEIDFEIQAVKFSPRRPDGTFYPGLCIDRAINAITV
jgi:hypothetical protein